MGNCLVTKLKGSVSDSELPKLGELRFHVNNSDDTNIFPFIIKSSDDFVIDVTGSGYMYKGSLDSQTDVTNHFVGNDTTGYRLSIGEYDVKITPKYEINYVSIGSNYAAQKCYLNLDEFKYNDVLDLIRCYGSGINGNVENLAEGSYLDARYTLLLGNVKDVAKLQLSNNCFIVSTEQIDFYISSIFNGSVEEFVSNLIPINYSKTFNFRPEILTFNSELQTVSLKAIIDSSGNATIQTFASVTVATYTKATNTWSYS